METNKNVTSKNQPQILNAPLNTLKNEGSPQLAPQLLSEPIQKLNEANGQRELPKTGTTKNTVYVNSRNTGKYICRFRCKLSTNQKELTIEKPSSFRWGAFLLSGDKLLIGANQKLCYSKVYNARKGGSK